MARKWFVRVGDKVYGPMNAEQLKQYAAGGKIGPDSLVGNDGQRWVNASVVKGLFANGSNGDPSTALASSMPLCKADSTVLQDAKPPTRSTYMNWMGKPFLLGCLLGILLLAGIAAVALFSDGMGTFRSDLARLEDGTFDEQMEALDGLQIEIQTQAAFARDNPEAKKRLTKMGQLAVPVLIRQLNNSDALVRDESAKCLGYFGIGDRPAVVPLTQAFLAGSNSAGVALYRVGPNASNAAPSLRPLLQHADNRRYIAAWILSKIEPKAADVQAILIEGLREPRASIVCAQILVATGAMNEEVLDLCLNAFRTSDSQWARCRAIECIARYAPVSDEAKGALVAAYKDTNPDVHNTAIMATAKLGKHGREFLPHLQEIVSAHFDRYALNGGSGEDNALNQADRADLDYGVTAALAVAEVNQANEMKPMPWPELTGY